MSKIGISLKIDVSKIEKKRLFKGVKGVYLDATAFVDLDDLDQYGNSGMITQDVSKEEKESGTMGAILGNSKVFWKGEGKRNHQSTPYQSPSDARGKEAKEQEAWEKDFDDDIPF
jgi:hypothetical protein|tara:strand:+ start:21 stop:365 length:345 start_codon:yes stop_codon:yes gene_type:complete